MTPAETRANHYVRLNAYRNSGEYQAYAREIGHESPEGALPSLIGQRWEIDEAIYDEFLDLMPPYLWTYDSFYCREAAFDDIHAQFTREGERYWCEYVRLPPPPVRANAPEPRP